jgi:hypothetical protein
MRSRKIVKVVAAALVAVACCAGPAGAVSRPRANTFDGTCKLSGRLTFAQPLGNEPRSTTLQDTAAGTCTGTLNGVRLQDAPVRNRAVGSGTLSCLAGSATTSDTLTFPHGIRVHFTTDTAGGLTQFAARFAGAVAGEGVVHVSFLPYLDQAALAACQAGTFRTARYDLEARTVTPVVG